ncbi:hypothetical protein [Bradyrhizobium sp. AUGA SZCCT0283]|uniref:hypothetical protein n=1 Tax=Bradyrhizobium sp. AUGA SZCCT0283 TaxID=2807671 RepID=UPI002011F6D9|nr:hypothetical protein [Bradyrhizobium sp. AUGA SZCCT0283]
MSRNWTLLTLILFLGSTGALQAEPLDSPGVVYIDGQPCNRACQSYMDWSYRALSARRHEERETRVAVPDEVEIERVEPVARPRVARQHVPVSRTALHAGTAASNGKAPGTKASNSKKIAVAKPAPSAPAKDMPAATAAVTPEKAVGETAPAIQRPEPKVERADRPAPAQAVAIAPSQPAEAPAPESKPEVKSQVAAEAKPEVALPPPATLEIAARPATPAPATVSNKASEIGKTASASPDDQDNLVALVLVRPEINSLSDLNNKNIAITEKQSASSGRVSAALMAAGAPEVQFREVKASAIDRLISGEVPAAVVLASREVANLFPELEGFRTFRLPLKARL